MCASTHALPCCCRWYHTYAAKHDDCVEVKGRQQLVLHLKEKQKDMHNFTFDQVLPQETTQQEVFDCKTGVRSPGAHACCMPGMHAAVQGQLVYSACAERHVAARPSAMLLASM